MTSISIAKKIDIPLTEQQRDVMRGVLFEMFGGFTDMDEKNWRRLWTMLMQGAEGEVFTINYTVNRDGIYHRRHMLFETKLFESQERFWNFEHFRSWLKLGSGFIEWRGIKGNLVATPKSISYSECDQATMEKFHNDMIIFLRTHHAKKYLWPHLSDEMAENMIEVLLGEFNL